MGPMISKIPMTVPFFKNKNCRCRQLQEAQEHFLEVQSQSACTAFSTLNQNEVVKDRFE
jgi:hypothetical protein